MTRPPVLYLHIPKAGGQTLSAALRRAHRGSVMLHPETLERPAGAVMADYTPEQLREARLIWGHFHHGLHEHLPSPVRHVTVLRDPIRRVVSLHRYILRQESHPLHETLCSRAMSLGEFVESGLDHHQTVNGQTRLLGGLGDGDPTEATLDKALENLGSFDVVGMTERFDETFVLLRETLKLRMPFYVRRNVAADAEPVAPEELERVAACNQLDVRLHAAATMLFEQQLTALGPRLGRSLRRLRLANALVNPPFRAYVAMTGRRW